MLHSRALFRTNWPLKELVELPASETHGLLRDYGMHVHFDIDDNDRSFEHEVVTVNFHNKVVSTSGIKRHS